MELGLSLISLRTTIVLDVFSVLYVELREAYCFFLSGVQNLLEVERIGVEHPEDLCLSV